MFVTAPNFSAGVLATQPNLQAWSDDLTTGVTRVLAETTLASPAATVTFSSIPATFRNLYLTLHARGTFAATLVTVLAQFNADTNVAHYHSEAMYASATTVTGAEFAPSAQAGVWVGDIPAASATSSIMYGGYETRVFDYQSAQEKPVISCGDARSGAGGSHRSYVIGGNWINTAAITSMTLLLLSGSFESFSRFTLYGEPAT